MTLAVTGHRPDKLGGYSPVAKKRLNDFALQELSRISPSPSRVLTGMALGWDLAIARACDALAIPFIAYIPFKNQDSRWPPISSQEYRLLLAKAAEVVNVCSGEYAAWKMHARNNRLVNDCDKLLALYDGSPSGTGSCVRYARCKVDPPLLDNCWPRWLEFCSANPL
jgi:uncharacterized phage-like protein YoqJ